MDIQVLNNLPENFVPRQQWPEYDLISTFQSCLNATLIGNNPRGARWGLWPFYFEEYVSDKEPNLTLSRAGNPHTRVIVWRRLTRTDQPKGWFALSKKSSRLEGFAQIRQDEYWKTWSKSARYYRKRWLNDCLDKTYTIEKVQCEEFARTYLETTAFKKAGRKMLDIAKRLAQHEMNAASYTEFWVARKFSDGGLAAGIVIANSPSCGGSYWLCGFYKEETRRDPLVLGLIDNWFRLCKERNIRLLHFGQSWQKGYPENWLGFSEFKSKFGLSYISYPPCLFRIVLGKFI